MFTTFIQDYKTRVSAIPKPLRPLAVILFLAPFIYGLYYEFSIYWTGFILVLLLALTILKSKTLTLTKCPGALLLALVLLCYFVVIPFAVDRGMAFSGALRMMVPALFGLLLLQYPREDTRRLWEILPTAAVVMMTLCLLLWALPETVHGIVFDNGRMSGFFQYANTFALFLLMAIMVVLHRPKVGVIEAAECLFLFAGILLSGSRFGLVLTVGSYVYCVITLKPLRKPLLIGGFVALVGALIAIFFSGLPKSVGRFANFNNVFASVKGRLLFWKDALTLFKSRWFGSGYLGYFYLQPTIQTGDYAVRFVHNDWLQVALDGGVLAGIAMIAGSFFSIKKSQPREKALFGVMALGMCFDFHLAYISMAFFLLLTFTYEDRYKIPWKLPYEGFTILCFGLFIWLGLSFTMDYAGNHKGAVTLFPGNTEGQIALLRSTGIPDGDAVATTIINQNPYIALAYNTKAAVAHANGNERTMIMYEDQALCYDAYNITQYETYLTMLSEAAIVAAQSKDGALYQLIVQKAGEIPKILEQVKARTHPWEFASDNPVVLTLPAAYTEYIRVLTQTLK